MPCSLNMVPVPQWTHRHIDVVGPWAGNRPVRWSIVVYKLLSGTFLRGECRSRSRPRLAPATTCRSTCPWEYPRRSTTVIVCCLWFPRTCGERGRYATKICRGRSTAWDEGCERGLPAGYGIVLAGVLGIFCAFIAFVALAFCVESRRPPDA